MKGGVTDQPYKKDIYTYALTHVHDLTAHCLLAFNSNLILTPPKG